MTAATQFRVMNVITVNAATGITAAAAVPIARCVIPHSVLDVLMNVPHATSLFARAVQLNVKNVKKCFVKTA